MTTPPQAWDRFFAALALTGNRTEASRVAGVPFRTVTNRLAWRKTPSPPPAHAAWLARYRAAKQAALDRRRAALRRVQGPSARLAALAAAGRTMPEIARELGCHPNSVARSLARLGLSPRRPKFFLPLPLTKPRPNMISKQQWDSFFTALSERGIVSDACLATGISNTPVYDRLAAARAPGASSRQKAWLVRYTHAMEAAVDRLEASAFGRARDGFDEPVVRRADKEGYKTVAHTRHYSDGLLMFLLKAHRPHVYRERSTTEHTGRDGRPIQTESRLFILPPIDPQHPE